MQDDLDTNFPELDIEILGVNLAGREAGNVWLSGAEIDLPWLQDVDSNGDSASDLWARWGVNYRDVVILDQQNVPLGAFNLTDNGLHIQQNYLGLGQILIDAASVVALPGDYNGNGRVEQSDLNLVLLNWGSPASPSPDGWLNSQPTGRIDQDELNGVLLNWGNAAALSSAAIPEPATHVLALVAGLVGLAGAIWRPWRTR